LQIRFSPFLIEDDSKINKLAVSLQAFDEKLNELWSLKPESYARAPLEKLCASLVESAFDLEKDGIKSNIPVEHIRSAASWSHLAPAGKRKVLIIENAQNMKDAASNSLLKLIEEPPASVSIVLTANRKEAIIPTILSRLRPYRFLKRDITKEKEVIRLVFKDDELNLQDESNRQNRSLISSYIESFAAQSSENKRALAAWFIVSLARVIVIAIKKIQGKTAPDFLNKLGEHYSPMAETLKLERAVKSETIIKIILAQSNNFEDDSFSRFMEICLEMISAAARSADNPQYIALIDTFRKYFSDAVTAVEVYNIKEISALESMIFNVKKAVTG